MMRYMRRVMEADHGGHVVRAAEATRKWIGEGPLPAGETGARLGDITPQLFTLLKLQMDERIWTAFDRSWPVPADATVQGAMVVRSAGERIGDTVVIPHGTADFIGSIRLNSDYEGGTLVLPEQGWRDDTVAVGTLAVWRSLDAQAQRTTPVVRGVKYRLALWWILPN